MFTSSSQEALFLYEVGGRLRTAIPTTVPKVGTYDDQELLQDGLAIALQMIRSANKSGKKPAPGNGAFYTLKHLRAGRRSTGTRTSVSLRPASQLTGRCRVHSLDEQVSSSDESGDEFSTLVDVLESPADDPEAEAGRRIDWNELVQKLDRVCSPFW